MKKKLFYFLYFCLLPSLSQAQITIEGAWVELRKAPIFSAPTVSLANTWGPSLQIGTVFAAEKTYGRWIYGTPTPPSNMKSKHFAPAGWIYSRMLLPSSDTSVHTKAQKKEAFLTAYYSKKAWKELSLPSQENSLLFFNFLESLVLSSKTMILFRQQDEINTHGFFPSIIPEVFASDTKENSLGIIGANLDFLKQEFQIAKKKKQQELAKQQAKILKAPKIPPLHQEIQSNILGRFLSYRSLKLPNLSHEEADGSLYMQAIAKRVLDSCPMTVQDYWKNKHWHIFRFLRLQTNTLPANSWLQFELPGSYFAISAKAIALASNEAEFAFLITRPLIKSKHIKRKSYSFQEKNWIEELKRKSPEIWENIQKAQSTKLSENLDVSDEVEIDITTMECMAKAGYSPDAGIYYLRKLFAAKEQGWAKWFHEHSIGIEYRIERTGKLLKEEKEKRQIPNATIINAKRFNKASELWNFSP